MALELKRRISIAAQAVSLLSRKATDKATSALHTLEQLGAKVDGTISDLLRSRNPLTGKQYQPSSHDQQHHQHHHQNQQQSRPDANQPQTDDNDDDDDDDNTSLPPDARGIVTPTAISLHSSDGEDWDGSEGLSGQWDEVRPEEGLSRRERAAARRKRREDDALNRDISRLDGLFGSTAAGSGSGAVASAAARVVGEGGGRGAGMRRQGEGTMERK